jgi:hypothetical protein
LRLSASRRYIKRESARERERGEERKRWREGGREGGREGDRCRREGGREVKETSLSREAKVATTPSGRDSIHGKVPSNGF